MQYKYKTLVGFFDGDGTFTLRVFPKLDNKIGIVVIASFTQKTANSDALEFVLRTLEYNTKIRNYKSDQGFSQSHININFSRPWGLKKFWKILKKNPPQSVLKLKDYLISCAIIDLTKSHLYQTYDERARLFAAVLLSYYTTYQTKKNSYKKKLSLRYWLNYLDPTNSLQYNKEGIKLALLIRRQILLKLDKQRQNLLKKKLSPSYVVGFFIADGTLVISYRFENNCKALAVRPILTIADGDIHLINAFQKFFKGEGWIIRQGTIYVFRLEGYESAKKLIIPLFMKYTLPAARTKQFLAFSRTCNLGANGFNVTQSGLFEMLNLSWEMCNEGLGRAKTLNQIKADAQLYLNYRLTRRVIRPLFLSQLRKKYKNTKGNWKNPKEKREKPVISNIAWLRSSVFAN